MKKYEYYDEYAEALKDVWKTPSMIEHCLKSTSRVVKVNGMIFTTDKPTIETRFCFGYDCSSVNNDSFDNANEMAQHARTNEQYFIDQNLKQIDDEIKSLKDDNVIKYCMKAGAFLSQGKDNPLRHINYQRRSVWLGSNNEDYEELPQEVVNAYIDALEKDRVDFVKRLNTYLKRFGLSKIYSWSYWRD